MAAKTLVAKCTYQLIDFNKHYFSKNRGLFLRMRRLMFKTYSKIILMANDWYLSMSGGKKNNYFEIGILVSKIRIFNW